MKWRPVEHREIKRSGVVGNAGEWKGVRLNGGQWSVVKWKGEEENEMERNKFVGREKVEWWKMQ